MIPLQQFGRTGHLSTRVIFGAAALGGMSQARADATLARVRAAGINHIDTARSYGESEVRLRPFLAEHRHEVFLATKTGERTAAAARRELEESLDRMGVDRVDLVQLHNLVEPDEWEVALGAGGAVEALVAAREEGLLRFIGVTGHGTRIPRMHLRSLDRFDFDSVLFPYNFTMLQDPAYRDDVEELLALCAARNVAAQTIKSAARGRWRPGDDRPHFSWYEPLPAGDELAHATRFVLARKQLFLNTSSDARLLEAIVTAASGDLTAPTDDVMAADTERLGITRLFDGAELERI
ncbi:MAG: aldo/keto reductase [Ilumatobacter sp.]|nr:aldo/keto reductase [Ilumatobacter sp.]MCB0984539.1 aldo/keto reductase [Ilumatobacter sp.]